jgi:hypothetical protein
MQSIQRSRFALFRKLWQTRKMKRSLMSGGAMFIVLGVIAGAVSYMYFKSEDERRNQDWPYGAIDIL